MQVWTRNISSGIGTGSLPELIRFSEENGLNLISSSQYVRAEKVSAYLSKQHYGGSLSFSEKTLLETILGSWH